LARDAQKNNMKTDDIRQTFLEFFKLKGHEIVASDCLVPKDDPTLLFTGAGMNQFKEKFLGRNVTYKRATTSQKCLRTGDLENVGRTSGHHTFFEMLGNFSFGDYFKKEAISWAWEFLTVSLKIEPDRLWASVYKDDKEAYGIWKDTIKIPEKKIIKFGEKENFWPSEAPTRGPNGPCGPCSEIFYDYGADVGCGKAGCTPACDCGRFIEVWNLVFTQFDRQSDGSLKPLPAKNIDTGMGLERLASVMQGVRTNFEIDIFQPVIQEIQRHIRSNQKPVTRNRKINAIADHIRAVVFTIADGVMPSNEERGYVVRKLIRRSIAQAQDLGIKGPFFYKLVGMVTDVMGRPYPELKAKRDDIAQVVKIEEESFRLVIETQIPRVEEAFKSMTKEKDAGTIARAAFNFYDTYGMPYEMLEDIAQRHRLEIDKPRFEELLEKQREMSRSKTKIKSEIFSETFAKKIEALRLKTEFLGYDKTHADATVLAVLESGEASLPDGKLSAGWQVVLDRTPFYGESGGQAGDRGTIETASGTMEVEDAKKVGDAIVHIGKMKKGRILKGEAAKAAIDQSARNRTMANHTATHLMHAALRKVLGDHVHQTGSLVDKDHLRFDFTHMKKMETREIARVEEIVNDCIKRSIAVSKQVKDVDAAKNDGAMALFGEKYDKVVRVITVGDISKELCGGTHVDNTKDIGIFRIISESSIASGVRRIEALTGTTAEEWISEQGKAEELKEKAKALKDKEKKDTQERLKKELEGIDALIEKGKVINGVRFISDIVEGANIDILRGLSDRIKSKEKNAVIVLATRDDEKASFITAVTTDLASKGALRANDLAKKLAELLGGSGGGRNDFAQGGGKDPARLDIALREMLEIVKEKLSKS